MSTLHAPLHEKKSKFPILLMQPRSSRKQEKIGGNVDQARDCGQNYPKKPKTPLLMQPCMYLIIAMVHRFPTDLSTLSMVSK